MSFTFYPTASVDIAPVKRVTETTVAQHFLKTTEYKQGVGGQLVSGSLNETAVQFPGMVNGLVDTLVRAYSSHHEIILTPDNFWMAILTQFSVYLTQNAEALREKFVSHQGQKELIVKGGGTLWTADFATMSQEMTLQIADNLKDDSVRDWALPSFTTTTHTDRVASSVVLMASMQKYFTYKFELECGLPKVTLLGTPDDYKKLAAKLDRLLEFEIPRSNLMKKWHTFLRPIVSELISASQGNPDLTFWNRVCTHYGGGSGPSYLSGWVTAFCVFNDKGEWQGDKLSKKGTVFDWPLVDTNDIPSGLVSVPVKVDDNGVVYNTRMLAGSFLANKVGEALSPRSDWCLGLIDEATVTKNQKSKPWE